MKKLQKNTYSKAIICVETTSAETRVGSATVKHLELKLCIYQNKRL